MRMTPFWTRLVVLWLAAQVPAFALNPAREADGYSLHGWFTEDGLPSNKIRDITQSRDGYLWLATGQGIARFDGKQCTNFNSATHPELVGNDFFAALQGPDAGQTVASVDLNGPDSRTVSLDGGGLQAGAGVRFLF